MNAQFLVMGVIWYVVFLFSTVCHEGAHALAGKLGGDPTAFHGGQASLNPLPHIRREVFGTVVVPIASYFLTHPPWMIGWASAPYDPVWAQRHPRRAAWMALAGPAANFSLMIAAAIAIRVGVVMGALRAPESISSYAQITQATNAASSGAQLAAAALSILFVLNLLLGTFNLLPFPPLDGHNGVTVLMSENMARRFMASAFSGLGFAGLLIAWFVYDKVFAFVYPLALNLLYYPGVHYH